MCHWGRTQERLERDTQTDRQGKVDEEESREGTQLWGLRVGGVTLFDQQTGGWEGGEVEKPLMLIVGSGLNPQSDWHFCHSAVGRARGVRRRGGGRTQRGLFLALHLHPLPVGGCVNNTATGKINCGQAAGLRGSLWEQREHWVGKACDLWGWEEISQGRPELPFNSVPKEMKALCKEDIEISRQKIVDILERPILLIFIVLMWKKRIAKGGEYCLILTYWRRHSLSHLFS